MMGTTKMTLPMNTSLNVTVSLGVSGGGGAAETVGNAPPDTEAVVVAIGRGLDVVDVVVATAAAAAAVALLVVFLRIVVLFLGLTGAVKH